MDKDTTKSTFTEYLNGLDWSLLSKEIDRLKLDRYTKKLFVSIWLKLMVYAQTHQVASLTDLSLHVRANPDLQRELGLSSISTAQLSRKLRAMNPEQLQTMFSQVMSSILAIHRPQDAMEQSKRLCIVDASTVTMCLERFPWAEFRSTKSGVKLHQRVVIADGTTIPDKAILTPARPSDKSQMDELIEVDPNALYLFDRGYLAYEKFDQYCESGTRFVTRLKHNACIREVEEERPVDPNSPVLRDAVIWLGQYPGYWMHAKLRLVEVRGDDGRTVQLLTNDLDLDAQEIGALYRKRWQIELFFKWIKQHLVIKRFYGTSKWAVYNQLWLALITYGLLVKIRQRTGCKKRLLEVYKVVQQMWAKPFQELIHSLQRKGTRKSSGRQAYPVDKIFAYTLQQYEQGDTKHLDELMYDPIL